MNLFWFILLRQSTVESVSANTRTIQLSYDETVFLNKIGDRIFAVLYLLEPFVIFNMTLDDFQLSIQNVPQLLAFVKHRIPQHSEGLYYDDTDSSATGFSNKDLKNDRFCLTIGRNVMMAIFEQGINGMGNGLNDSAGRFDFLGEFVF
ncbi:MAG: hypothetical protein ABII06_01540 [Pseudomonadota bacterium]